jgi:hypothetical protein
MQSGAQKEELLSLPAKKAYPYWQDTRLAKV